MRRGKCLPSLTNQYNTWALVDCLAFLDRARVTTAKALLTCISGINLT